MQSNKRGSPKSEDQSSPTASNQSRSSHKIKPVSKNDVINHVKHAVDGISAKIDKNSLNKIYADIETEEGSSYFMSAINDIFDKYVSSSTLKALTVIYIILLRDTFPNFKKILQYYLLEILTLTTVTFRKPKDISRDTIHLLARSIFLNIANHQKLPDPSYFGFDKSNMIFHFVKDHSEDNLSKKIESIPSSDSKSILDEDKLLKSFSSNIPVNSPSIDLNDQYGDNLIDFNLYEPNETSTTNTVDLIDSNEFEIDLKPSQIEENISLQPKPELTIDDATFVDTKSSIDITLQKNPSAPFKPNSNSFEFTESDKASLSTPSINKNQNKIIDDNHFIDLTQSSFSNNGFNQTDSNQKLNDSLLDSFESSQPLTSDLFNSKLTSDSFNSNQQLNNNLMNLDQNLNNESLNSNEQLNNNSINSNQQLNNSLKSDTKLNNDSLNSDIKINNNLVNSNQKLNSIPFSPIQHSNNNSFTSIHQLKNDSFAPIQQSNNNSFSSIHQLKNNSNDFTGSNKTIGILKRDSSINSNARQIFDNYYKSTDDKKKTKFNVQYITKPPNEQLTTASLSELPITPLNELNDALKQSKSELNSQSFVPFEDKGLTVNKQRFSVRRVSLPEKVNKIKLKPISDESPFGYEQNEPISIQKIDVDYHPPTLIENNVNDNFEPISKDQNSEFVPITRIGSNLISLDDDTSDQFEPITPINNTVTPLFDTNAENKHKPILSDSDSDDGQFVPITPVRNQINSVNSINDDFEPITPKKGSLDSLDRYVRFNQNESNEDKNSFSDNFVPITPIDKNTLKENIQIDDKNNFSDNFVPITPIDKNNGISLKNSEINNSSDQFRPITPINENISLQNTRIDNNSDQFTPISDENFNKYTQFTPIDDNQILVNNKNDFSDQFSPINDEKVNNSDYSDQFVPISLPDEDSVIPIKKDDDYSDQFVPISQPGSGANLEADDELINKNNQFELIDNYEPILRNEEKIANENKSKGKKRFNIQITSSSSMDFVQNNHSKESLSKLFDNE